MAIGLPTSVAFEKDAPELHVALQPIVNRVTADRFLDTKSPTRSPWPVFPVSTKAALANAGTNSKAAIATDSQPRNGASGALRFLVITDLHILAPSVDLRPPGRREHACSTSHIVRANA